VAGTILPRIVGQDRPEHDVKREDSPRNLISVDTDMRVRMLAAGYDRPS
jgi:hypothetical protein